MGSNWISVDVLQEAVGEERAREVLLGLGGRSLYIPRRPRRDHDIARQLGLGLMAKLCLSFGGSWVTFANPYGRTISKPAILASLREGCRVATAARLHGVSERYVQRLKKEIRLSR